MKKNSSNNEKYISVNKFSNLIYVNRSTIYLMCVKNKFRFFKFNGARCLEIRDAICLAETLYKSSKLTKIDYDLTIEKLNSLLL